MIIIIGLAVLTIIGVILVATDISEMVGLSFMAIGVLLLIVVLLAITANRFETKSQIAEFNSFKSTIAEARRDGIDNIERAALVNKIAEWNEWVASVQFRNESYMDIFWPDEVMTLEPIK